MVMQLYGYQDATGVCTLTYLGYCTNSIEAELKEFEYNNSWRWFIPNYDAVDDMWFIREMTIMAVKFMVECGFMYCFYYHFVMQNKILKQIKFTTIALFG